MFSLFESNFIYIGSVLEFMNDKRGQANGEKKNEGLLNCKEFLSKLLNMLVSNFVGLLVGAPTLLYL